MAAEDIIQAARTLLTAESSWTTKAIARKASGQPCGPLSVFAAKRDIYGALVKAKQDLNDTQEELNIAMLLLRAKLTTSNKDIDYFNDRATHAEVMAILT
ncbi:hypothetical protein FDI24_gp184 [Acidovorax phage ACP17]|uniref:Uncharacterized protein n=1 Tax=Acidovorax phage ACP17 TaxID=2010329 RepID=A0A218M348_9CAUD|nr:hypothetical protein FDI24_gp184 [Acidovorax phage ACP17]ASD50466.1 hypothetical protein [Acidovorax phage ACP17]